MAVLMPVTFWEGDGDNNVSHGNCNTDTGGKMTTRIGSETYYLIDLNSCHWIFTKIRRLS